MTAQALLLVAAATLPQEATHTLVRVRAFPDIGADAGTFAYVDAKRLILSHSRSAYLTLITDTESTEIGRRGQGPGEFRIAGRVGMVADTIWVADPVLRRVTTFPPGSARPAVHPANVAGGAALMVRAYLGSGIIVGTVSTRGDSIGRVLRVQDAEPVTLATFSASRLVDIAFGSSLEDGAIQGMLSPFATHTLVGVDPVTRRVVLLDRPRHDRYTLRWLDVGTRGALQEITYNVAPQRAGDFPSKIADSWWTQYGPNFPRVREGLFKERVLEAIGRPEFLPAVTSMLVGATGQIWIQGSPRLPSEPTHWTILDGDGRLVGTVDLPPARKLLALADGTAAILEDEAVVAIYRIVPRGQN